LLEGAFGPCAALVEPPAGDPLHGRATRVKALALMNIFVYSLRAVGQGVLIYNSNSPSPTPSMLIV